MLLLRPGLVLLLALAFPQDGEAPTPLPLGDWLTLQLGAGSGTGQAGARAEAGPAFEGLSAATRLELVPEQDGPLTVWVESADANVLVRCVDERGQVLLEDDDGGVEWNARLVLDGVAGEPLQLVAGFTGAAGGALRVRAREGAVARPTGVALAQARATFHRERGRALQARGEGLQAAIALHDAGTIDFSLGQYASAQASYRTVLELAEAADHALLVALAQAYLGAIHVAFEELTEARPLLEQALAGAVALQQAQIEMFAQSKLGQLQLALGERESAGTSLARALLIAETLGDRGNEVVLCSLQGQLAQADGQLELAQEWHERAVRGARELGVPATLASALLDAGRFHEQRYAYGAAREHFEEALEHATTRRLRASVLGHLGNVSFQTGDFLAAVDLYEQVLTAARELGDAALQPLALASLGQAHSRLGNLVLARERLEEALALLGDAGAPRQRATILQFLASVLVASEQGDLARALLDEALPLAQQAGDLDLQAQLLSVFVAWHYRRGEYEQALEPARQHVTLGQELGQPWVLAAGLDNLAELHLRLGRLDQARTLGEQAVAMARELDDPRALPQSLLTLVEVAVKQDRPDEVAAIVAEAEAVFERLDLSQMDPEQASLARAVDVFALWGKYSQDAAALALARTEDEAQRAALMAQGFRRAGLWKGRGLLQGIAEHRRGTRSAQTMGWMRERRETLAQREECLKQLATEARADGEAERLAALLAEAQALASHAADLQARVRQAAPRDAALDAPEGITPERLATVLDDRDVLIEFTDGSERLYAYVVQGDSVRFHDLGGREALESRVRSFLEGMSDPARLAPPERIATQGRALYDELLDPLLAGVPDQARLVIIPTAQLAALPFGALVMDAPDQPQRFDQLTFVLDRREVCYAPSAPVLALLADEGPRATPGAALILADPLYEVERSSSGTPPRGRPRQGSWVRLPGTRGEALAIARVLLSGTPDTPSDAAPGTRQRASSQQLDTLARERSMALEQEAFSLYLGDRVTRQLLSGSLRDYAIIHCASHGWVDAGDPRGSGLVLTATDEDDGFLSMADILELDLDADLAVLSACETGRGAVRKGEGVQSLARAFLYAGARSVVASLWPVDDHETEQIMTRFYADYAGLARAPSPALQAARLAVRHAPSDPQAFRGVGRGKALVSPTAATPGHHVGHPYFWASFVMVGLPRLGADADGPSR